MAASTFLVAPVHAPPLVRPRVVPPPPTCGGLTLRPQACASRRRCNPAIRPVSLLLSLFRLKCASVLVIWQLKLSAEALSTGAPPHRDLSQCSEHESFNSEAWANPLALSRS